MNRSCGAEIQVDQELTKEYKYMLSMNRNTSAARSLCV